MSEGDLFQIGGMVSRASSPEGTKIFSNYCRLQEYVVGTGFNGVEWVVLREN